MKKVLKYLGLGILLLIVFAVVAGFIAHEPLPKGAAGPAANALARKMEAALNKDAWDDTRFVSWQFRTGTDYLWDKDRKAVRVKWGDTEVYLRTQNQSGRVFENGKEVTDEEQKQASLAKAWAFFANDSFWLCAPMKAFDPGTTREIVKLEDGSDGLLVRYNSGGVTPGDSYLWHLTEEGLPKAWQMWVNIIPVGGLEFSWEDWTAAPQPRVAQQHNGSLFSVPIQNLSFPEFSADDNPLQLLWQN